MAVTALTFALLALVAFASALVTFASAFVALLATLRILVIALCEFGRLITTTTLTPVSLSFRLRFSNLSRVCSVISSGLIGRVFGLTLLGTSLRVLEWIMVSVVEG